MRNAGVSASRRHERLGQAGTEHMRELHALELLGEPSAAVAGYQHRDARSLELGAPRTVADRSDDPHIEPVAIDRDSMVHEPLVGATEAERICDQSHPGGAGSRTGFAEH